MGINLLMGLWYLNPIGLGSLGMSGWVLILFVPHRLHFLCFDDGAVLAYRSSLRYVNVLNHSTARYSIILLVWDLIWFSSDLSSDPFWVTLMVWSLLPSQPLSLWGGLAHSLVSSISMVLFHSDCSSFSASLSERSSLSIQFKEASWSLSITSFYFSLYIMLTSLLVPDIYYLHIFALNASPINI